MSRTQYLRAPNPRNTGVNGLTDGEKRRIGDAYLAGETITSIMRRFRKDDRVVKAVLSERGISIRPRGGSSKT